ncbi:hypothetical protein GWK47_022419 [Chionoecetes opilio]|uniref:Uncharacterized protein n=1 Tax=Chionoecetes opilio TaxID=41210 RepID=A0A8J4XN15_CHIOP|nr:hypothetical protein GWK47_022419 [Chionoecetes opilio]
MLQSLQPVTAPTPSAHPAPAAFETAAGQRVRFHSCTTDPLIDSRPQSAPAPTLEAEEDVFPTKDSSPPASSTLQSSTHSSTNTSRCFSNPISTSTPLSSLPPSSTPFSSLPPSSARLLREEQKENTPYCGDYIDNPPTSESPPTQDKMMTAHKLRARRAARRIEGRGLGLSQPRSKSEVSGMFHPTHNNPSRHLPLTTNVTTAAVTASNSSSGARSGYAAPLATTNLRDDGDTNSNPYPEEHLPSVALPAGGTLRPPSQSMRRKSLPSPYLGHTNSCLPPSLLSNSCHSARESSKPTLYAPVLPHPLPPLLDPP